MAEEEKKGDFIFEDEEEPGTSSLSAVLKAEAPKIKKVKKEVPKVKEIKIKDLEAVKTQITNIKSIISGGSNLHRVFLALGELEDLVNKL